MRFAVKFVYLLLASLFISMSVSCSRESIKIGLVMDLSGRGSELGISGRNGAEIAVDEINDNGGIGGRKIEMIIKNDKGDAKEAQKVDNELVGEKIAAAVGHMTSGPGLAGMEVFSNAGILMVSPTMSTESLTGKDDNFIRVIDSNFKQGEILAKAAINRNNGKMAVLYEFNNRAYSKEVCDYFIENYKKAGGKVVFEDGYTSNNETDFDRISKEIVNSGADGALVVTGGLDLAVFAQKLKAKKSDIQIYSGMWAMTGDLIVNGGKACENILLPGACDNNNNNPRFVEFKEKYISRFSVEPTFSSVYCYESIYMLAEALKVSDDFRAETLKESILRIKTFKGLQGDFTIDKFGDTLRGYYLMRIKDAYFQRER